MRSPAACTAIRCCTNLRRVTHLSRRSYGRPLLLVRPRTQSGRRFPGRHGRRLPKSSPHLRTTLPACFGRIIWPPGNHLHPLYGFTNSAHSAAERRSDRISIRSAEADIKAAGAVSGSTLSSNSYTLADASPTSPVCSRVIDISARDAGWQVLGGGFLAGSTNLNPAAEYRLALRLRLLRSPASLNVGWYPVPVQFAGLSDSRSNAFFSLPQQSRPVHPAARPHPGRYHRPDR